MKEKKAPDYFESGFNCAQSVASSLLAKEKIDSSHVLKMCTAFSAGMCYKGKTCGAVVGAYLALGYFHGIDNQKNTEGKDALINIISDFDNQFIAKHKTLNCSELIEGDVSNPDKLKKLREEGVFRKKCPTYVGDAENIAKSILSKLL